MKIERIQILPPDILELVHESKNDNFGAISKLVEEFKSGRNRFDFPGEALFTAYHQSKLVGIGGLNIDPYINDLKIGRVRRLYVSKAFRRQGIGRAIVEEIERSAIGHFKLLRVFTTNPNAVHFYSRLGYMMVNEYKVSHVKKLTT